MKKTKFRAWDKANKTMTFATFWEIRTHQVPEFHTVGDFVFMQFTGKQDKDKVNIYAGDKVLWTWSWSHRNIEGIIEWDNNELRWVITNTCFEHNRQVPLSNYPVKVIGTIHDNPELMEDTK